LEGTDGGVGVDGMGGEGLWKGGCRYRKEERYASRREERYSK